MIRIFMFMFMLLMIAFSCDFVGTPVYNIDVPEIEAWLKDNPTKSITVKMGYIKWYVYRSGAIEYVTDINNYGVFEKPESPEQVHRTKKTDCEGQAGYTAWLIYQYLGVKCVFYKIRSVNKNSNHCVAYYPKYDFYLGIDKYDSKYFKDKQLDIRLKASWDFFYILYETFN